ncbi:hypothetical protein SAMN04489730_5687 [Amycolatopsis australiensis]|uniref:Uncharacterized protein n=1 Tax=Amycolatopsis australiensis TaxID=546364 RepID=A0A1K1SHP5_9PSEU|nr:hypothetical protein SAMN04489730_5687 [Amycolatopsis australiensis]
MVRPRTPRLPPSLAAAAPGARAGKAGNSGLYPWRRRGAEPAGASGADSGRDAFDHLAGVDAPALGQLRDRGARRVLGGDHAVHHACQLPLLTRGCTCTGDATSSPRTSNSVPHVNGGRPRSRTRSPPPGTLPPALPPRPHPSSPPDTPGPRRPPRTPLPARAKPGPRHAESDSPPRFARLLRWILRIRPRARGAEHRVEDRRRFAVVALRPLVPQAALFLSHAPSFCDPHRFRSGSSENRPRGGSPAWHAFSAPFPTRVKTDGARCGFTVSSFRPPPGITPAAAGLHPA